MICKEILIEFLIQSNCNVHNSETERDGHYRRTRSNVGGAKAQTEALIPHRFVANLLAY